MKKIVIIDSYYPAFIGSLPPIDDDYDGALRKTLQYCFGTFDAFSMALSDLGHSVIDIIANYDDLQACWPGARGRNRHEIVMLQIEEAHPDIVFLQDLSFFTPVELQTLSDQGYILAAQSSCALPELSRIAWLDVVFTSFPFYVDKFKQLGIDAHYLPLAFDPIVLERTKRCQRTRDIVFVGGIGHQWTNTLPVLRAVAEAFPQAEFYGYGYEQLRESDPIRQRYRGPAWGVSMYEKFRSAKIVLNRHGEISRDYANNLRMFEATGCGALLLTERKTNIRDFFAADEIVTYASPTEAVAFINHYLTHDAVREEIAAAGQVRTLNQHTYAQRIPYVATVLETMCQMRDTLNRVM